MSTYDKHITLGCYRFLLIQMLRLLVHPRNTSSTTHHTGLHRTCHAKEQNKQPRFVNLAVGAHATCRKANKKLPRFVNLAVGAHEEGLMLHSSNLKGPTLPWVLATMPLQVNWMVARPHQVRMSWALPSCLMRRLRLYAT